MTETGTPAEALRARAERCIRAGEYAEAIYALRRYLSAADVVWPDARSEGMLLLAQCHLHENNRTEAERWLLRACAEAPSLPQPWLEAAAFYAQSFPQAAALCSARASAPELFIGLPQPS
ncbi:MAG: hypothetical protein IJT44_12650 [Clostridia bacterium]|nr:hypothetical protein [Clostridia bacterium]